MTTTIELPWPPSVNAYWRSNRGVVHIASEGRVYRGLVLAIAYEQRVAKLLGRLRVSIDAAPPDGRRRDLDNVLKALLDALQHAGAYGDDSQIDDLRIVRLGASAPGRVLVRIEELPGG